MTERIEFRVGKSSIEQGEAHNLSVRETSQQNFDVVVAEMNNLEIIKPPSSKKGLATLKRSIVSATRQDPLTIYVGSCPDYSHNNGLYTHESLGSGIPLLSQIHLKYDLKLIDLLAKHQIPFQYILMVADVEALDSFFADKFTQGDHDLFLTRCASSANLTQSAINASPELTHINNLRSSSFFEEFGEENFMRLQQGYQQVLMAKYYDDFSFRARVTGDIIARMTMYQRMYQGKIENMSLKDREEFLVERTLRTMAQYLTLGRLISDSAKHPIIINHPTRNIGVYNERNKILLPGDTQNQPTIPIFEMAVSVY